jgi:uncharacterized protein YndB with AHSA1/START domain
MNGHALSVERVIDARPEAIFDAFIANTTAGDRTG